MQKKNVCGTNLARAPHGAAEQPLPAAPQLRLGVLQLHVHRHQLQHSDVGLPPHCQRARDFSDPERVRRGAGRRPHHLRKRHAQHEHLRHHLVNAATHLLEQWLKLVQTHLSEQRAEQKLMKET